MWADFVITRVSYNENNMRIVKVECKTDNGKELINREIKNRSVIVDSINEGHTYITARFVNGKWKRGDTIIAYFLDGEYFIRTDGNETKSDNLGELPTF